MPAKHLLRVTEEGTYCHIYNKGIESKNIFQDEQDYSTFIGFLKEYLSPPPSKSNIKKEFTVNGKTYMGTPHQPKNYHEQVELLAYSLSPHSFHLLLRQTQGGSLQSLLRSLGTRYSMYFNKKYDRKGALFEGPYKSVAVKSDRLLLSLTAKFHQPDVAHSSATDYTGQTETDWINKDTVLKYAKDQNINYKKYIHQYAKDETEKEKTKEVSLEPEPKLERITPEFVPSKPIHTANQNTISTYRKVSEFLVTIIVFVILSAIGFRNIQVNNVSIAKADTTTNVLGETTFATATPVAIATITPSPTPLVTAAPSSSPVPLTIGQATIKISDGSPEVAIRKSPSVYSEKVGAALDGEVYQVVRKETGWLAIVLKGGIIGFISPRYAFLEQNTN